MVDRLQGRLQHLQRVPVVSRTDDNRKYALKVRFGMTQADYESLLAAQNGCSAICHRTTPNGFGDHFHIDHDRNCCPRKKCCGKCVRGLLCMQCNVRLNTVEDATFIEKATAYLATFKMATT